ncbi:opioid growth factor receptor-related protein [Brevundimonas sp. GCM10030266]|uniref:opioid growth factor receptor-related protein n=1 Tax=Brevundimonas sp. GCM10030266 TaxID=3273386 RepID=UPI003617E6E3
MLAFNNAALEQNHDYIQWLFPLTEPSGAVPDAPVLTTEEVAAIAHSSIAQIVLAGATDRMASFYRDTDRWLRAEDHNHLRITRIIRSLRLLRGDAAAEGFKAWIMARVEATGAPVNSRSRGYWATA